MQLPGDPSWSCSPRSMASHLALRYVDGKLTEALTKQNRCVMDWIEKCPLHPKAAQAQDFGTVEIHGEMWGVKKDSKDKRTPQSLLLSLPSTNGKGSRSMFAAYGLLGPWTNESQAVEDLRRYGFDVPDTYVCTKPSEVNKMYKQWLDGHVSERQPFNTKLFKGWPTDGVVAKGVRSKIAT